MIKSSISWTPLLLLSALECLVPAAQGQEDNTASRLAAIQPMVAAQTAVGDAGRMDVYGDPLPRGALARLGTIRYRHAGWYKRIAVLPDNQTFVVATKDNTVRFWDAATGRSTREIALGEAMLQGFGLSRGGQHLAVLASIYDPAKREYEVLLKVWEMPSWKEQTAVRWIEPIAEGSQRVALAPDGALVATGGRSGKLRVWDTVSGQEILSYAVIEGEIESIDFSPNGELVAVAGRRGVALWSLLSGDKPIRLPQLSRGGQVALFSPDGTQLVVGADDNNAAQLYEVPSGKLVRTLRGKVRGYYREGLAFLADKGQLVVPANSARAVEFFDLASGDVVRTLDAGVLQPRGVAVSADGRFAAMIASEAEVKVWDLDSGELLTDRYAGHAERPYEMVFLSGGNRIATGALDGTIRIWDAQTGKQDRVLRHERWVAALAASADGSRLLSSGLDDTLRLWDARSGEEIYKLAGHGRHGGNRFTDVAFASDGKLLSFGSDMYLRAWDAGTGKAIAEYAIRPSSLAIEETAEGTLQLKEGSRFGGGIEGLSMVLGSARFSTDGKRLFVATEGKALHTFDVNTGQEVDSYGPDQPLGEYALSRDGLLLATVARKPQSQQNAGPALNRSVLQLLRWPSKESVWQVELSGHSRDVCFSSDGQLIATPLYGQSPAAKSKTWISVCSVETGREIYRIEGFPQDSHHLTFSPDGRCLAASVQDSSVLVWELEKFRLD